VYVSSCLCVCVCVCVCLQRQTNAQRVAADAMPQQEELEILVSRLNRTRGNSGLGQDRNLNTYFVFESAPGLFVASVTGGTMCAVLCVCVCVCVCVRVRVCVCVFTVCLYLCEVGQNGRCTATWRRSTS
jgi:hypothetical protein